MPEIGTSGLMSGDGKRGGASASVLAPVLDSTEPVGVEPRAAPGVSFSTGQVSRHFWSSD